MVMLFFSRVNKHSIKQLHFAHVILLSLSLFVGCLLLLGCSNPAETAQSLGEGIVVEIWASNGCPKEGQAVTLRATITNKRSQDLVVALSQNPVLDIVIGQPDTSLNRWSAGKVLTPELTHAELRPGASKSIEMQWVAHLTGRAIVSAQFIERPNRDPIIALIGLPGRCSTFLGP